jgi:hypothetical protein
MNCSNEKLRQAISHLLISLSKKKETGLSDVAHEHRESSSPLEPGETIAGM